MVERGVELTRSEARTRRDARGVRDTNDRSHASARLGLTLRSVLLSPRDGFRAALAAADRRDRVDRRPAEGIAPYILTALGGAAVALLWLKVGALLGVREVCSPNYLAGFIAATAVLGAVLASLARTLWSFGGRRAIEALRGDVPKPHALRLVWGASSFPHVFALALLLPLDLAIVGQDTFTTAELVDPVSTAWAAFSIALGASAVVWSLFLLVRGVEASSGLVRGRAVAAAATAVGSFAVVIAAFAALTFLLPQGAGCPT